MATKGSEYITRGYKIPPSIPIKQFIVIPMREFIVVIYRQSTKAVRLMAILNSLINGSHSFGTTVAAISAHLKCHPK